MCKDIMAKIKNIDANTLMKSEEKKNLLNMASKTILCLNGEIKTAYS